MKSTRLPLILAMMTVSVVTSVGCRAKRQRIAQYSNYSRIEAAGEEGLCPFGRPESLPGWNHGPTTIIARDGYILEHANLDKIALWVCEHVTDEHIVGEAHRKHCRFKSDPELSRGDRATLSDYRSSGYDRGHQAPAGDFKYDQDRICESFYLSNMAPQVGSGFNRNVWRVLETRTRDCVAQSGDAYIITGGMFFDPDEDGEENADGIVDYYVIGRHEVAVPTHFYKIVAGKDSTGNWRAVGFVLANVKHDKVGGDKYDFSGYIRSIEWIEERTGLNFMPQLEDDENPDLKDRLELDPAELWPCFGAD